MTDIVILELLLQRNTVISLAVIGGAFSLLASWFSRRELAFQQVTKWLNRMAYGFMMISIILFIAAGMFPPGK